MKIKYFTKCLQSIYIEKEGNNCSGLSVGSQVNFTVSIEVIYVNKLLKGMAFNVFSTQIVDSPKREGDRFQTVVIHPRGLNEKLSIEIEIIRDCPCELIGEVTFVFYPQLKSLKFVIYLGKQGCPNLCIDFEPCVKCRQRNESFTANCMKKFNCEDLIIVPEYNSSTGIVKFIVHTSQFAEILNYYLEKSASERVCKINDKETDW